MSPLHARCEICGEWNHFRRDQQGAITNCSKCRAEWAVAPTPGAAPECATCLEVRARLGPDPPVDPTADRSRLDRCAFCGTANPESGAGVRFNADAEYRPPVDPARRASRLLSNFVLAFLPGHLRLPTEEIVPVQIRGWACTACEPRVGRLRGHLRTRRAVAVMGIAWIAAVFGGVFWYVNATTGSVTMVGALAMVGVFSGTLIGLAAASIKADARVRPLLLLLHVHRLKRLETRSPR